MEGLNALITGAARGIGKSIAETFARKGANLALLDKNWDDSDPFFEKISKDYGVKVFGHKLDVCDKEDCIKITEKAVKEFGKIDILVNNAGITRDNMAVRMSEEEWDSVLNVNLKGAFLMMQSVSKHMMKQRSGCIINIASIAGQTGNPGQANYSASKGGLISLTKSMARELAGRNVRINAVAPGFIDTQMTQEMPQIMRDRVLGLIPLARAGTAQDVANAVLFLASDNSNYITGHTLSVNGGLYI